MNSMTDPAKPRCFNADPHEPHLTTFAPEMGVENGPCAGVPAGQSADPKFRDGYCEGYLDCAAVLMRRYHEREIERIERETPLDIVKAAILAIDRFVADTPEQAIILLSMWSRRALLTTDNVAEVVTALYGMDETGAALVSLWARVDELTAVEVNAIRAALAGQRDDGGFAERFLEQRRQAAEGVATTDTLVAPTP